MKAQEAIKKTFYDGNSMEISKGDKIKVTKGDLINVTGTVMSIEDGYVNFKPSIEGLNENLKVEAN